MTSGNAPARETVLQARRQVLIRDLIERLGGRLVAYTLGEPTTAALRPPALPTDLAQHVARLELLEHVLQVLAEDDTIGQAWLMGLNPELGDIAPARLVREQGATAASAPLLAAALAHRSM